MNFDEVFCVLSLDYIFTENDIFKFFAVRYAVILHGDAACSVLCVLPFILFVPHHSQMDPDRNIPFIVVYSLALFCS